MQGDFMRPGNQFRSTMTNLTYCKQLDNNTQLHCFNGHYPLTCCKVKNIYLPTFLCFLYLCTKIWNSLLPHILQSQTLSSF